MVISASFLIGYFKGLADAFEMTKEEPEERQNLYCFQCEFDMSVKEVNGALCCGNCGLRH